MIIYGWFTSYVTDGGNGTTFDDYCYYHIPHVEYSLFSQQFTISETSKEVTIDNELNLSTFPAIFRLFQKFSAL